ncbi:hypothetical protein N431DRAFT_15583 [Stipitochalara longipes BDJ]|nr:hypothetical protein N431DRAFT_15583 [Stipitochalara longipes BDJ]
MVWILFCLASNSMAQPSGRLCGASTRYRVYLCSSPLFCFADGLAILVRVLVTSIYHHISPLKASRLAILSRADERHDTKRNQDTSFEDPFPIMEHEGLPCANAAAWPRWLFFTVGTLPATIQLASFSGVPMTQTLGLMFVSSFAIIELVTFLSTFKEQHKTIPEVLRYLKVEGVPIEEQEVRFKAYTLIKRLEWFDHWLFLITLVAQGLMTAELTGQIWVLVRAPTCKLFEFTFMEVFTSIYSISVSLFLLLTVVRLILWLCGKGPSLDRWFPWRQWFWFWFLANYVLVLIPHPGRSPVRRSSSFSDKGLAFGGVTIIFYYFYFGLAWLCERCPLIAKVLLIDRTPWDLAKIEHLPREKRKGYELEAGVIYFPPWNCFCIFLSNLALCILWYAFVYNSTGTVNPGWTHVFG